MFPREDPENLVVRRLPTTNQAPVHVLYQKALGPPAIACRLEKVF